MHRKRKCCKCSEVVDLDHDEHVTVLVTRWLPDKFRKTVVSKTYFHARCTE